MLEGLWLVFVATVGASIGSFINVLAYRLPLGKSVVKPASRCPACDHPLGWKDNIPVFGWLLLKGRCRYCRVPVSPQYPLVEGVTALLFTGWALICFFTDLRPGFGISDVEQTAPVFAVTLVFLAALLAASIIDAEHFIIPLVIPWTAIAVAVVIYPLAVHFSPTLAASVDSGGGGEFGLAIHDRLQRLAEVEMAAQTPGRISVQVAAVPWAGTGLSAAAMGAMLGWVLSLVLMKLKILPRSFELPEQEVMESWPTQPEGPRQLLLLLAPIGAAVAAGLWMDRDWSGRWEPMAPMARLGFCALGAYAIAAAALFLIGQLRGSSKEDDSQAGAADTAAKFPEPPNVRLEMAKEGAFLLLPVLGAVGGFLLLQNGMSGPVSVVSGALGGVLSGFLIAAGIAWAVRIFGTLAFGREAMGLGDVHLMAAMGAVMGWREAVLGFFLAAAVGLGHMLLVSGFGKRLRWRGHHIPYGPHLAAAAVVVMILREPLVVAFGLLLGL